MGIQAILGQSLGPSRKIFEGVVYCYAGLQGYMLQSPFPPCFPFRQRSQ